MNSDKGDSLSPTPAMMTCTVPMEVSLRDFLTGTPHNVGPQLEMTDVITGSVPFLRLQRANRHRQEYSEWIQNQRLSI